MACPWRCAWRGKHAAEFAKAVPRRDWQRRNGSTLRRSPGQRPSQRHAAWPLQAPTHACAPTAAASPAPFVAPLQVWPAGGGRGVGWGRRLCCGVATVAATAAAAAAALLQYSGGTPREPRFGDPACTCRAIIYLPSRLRLSPAAFAAPSLAAAVSAATTASGSGPPPGAAAAGRAVAAAALPRLPPGEWGCLAGSAPLPGRRRFLPLSAADALPVPALAALPPPAAAALPAVEPATAPEPAFPACSVAASWRCTMASRRPQSRSFLQAHEEGARCRPFAADQSASRSQSRHCVQQGSRAAPARARTSAAAAHPAPCLPAAGGATQARRLGTCVQQRHQSVARSV